MISYRPILAEGEICTFLICILYLSGFNFFQYEIYQENRYRSPRVIDARLLQEGSADEAGNPGAALKQLPALPSAQRLVAAALARGPAILHVDNHNVEDLWP